MRQFFSRKNLKFAVVYVLIFGLLTILLFFLGLSFWIPFGKTIGILFLLTLALVIGFRASFDKLKGKLFLVLFSTTLTLFVGDLVMRTAMKSKIYYRPQEMFGNKMPEYPKLLGRYDKNVSYSGQTYGDLAALSGELKFAQHRDITFITDERGYRNKPGQAKKKNNVLLLGDSFGVGTGTHQDSTIASFLSVKHEVYNLSYPGSPLQELVNLAIDYDHVGHTNRPTAIWLLFSGNDLPSFLSPEADKILDLVDKDQLSSQIQNNLITNNFTKLKSYLNRSPVRQLILRVFQSNEDLVAIRGFGDGKKMYFLKDYINASTLTGEEIMENPRYDDFKKVFEVAKDFSKRKDVVIKVFLIPTKYEVYEWIYDQDATWEGRYKPSGYSRVLATILKELEIEFTDSKPFLVEAAKAEFERNKRTLWWLDDTHISPLGHERLAELIQKELHKEP